MLKKFENCLLGLAAGDAAGMPAEGMTREQVKKIYGWIDDLLPSPLGDLKAGEWTDDTEQALVLAESIIETVYFDPENFAEKLKNWFLRTSCRRIGPTSYRAILNLLNGVHWSRSGVDSDTCGAAMRVAPIGLAYSFSLDLVERYAELSAIVTHRNSAAIAGAVAVALAVACNVRGEDFGEVVERVSRYDELMAEKIDEALRLECDLDEAVEKLGNTISSLDVVPMAFYCFSASEDLRKTILLAANAGGDADSIAAIAGALKGSASFEVPEEWLKKLKDVERIRETAARLYELYKRITDL
ncbi:MAG: ADP-ribosylglycohydrolase family protein [Archaeoglobaceae archaeon]